MLRRGDLAGNSRNPLQCNQARRRLRRGRAFFRLAVGAAAGAFLAVPWIHAEPAVDENCDDVPPARQALCWMVLACGALADEQRRLECYQVAAQSLGGDVVDGAEPSAISVDARPPASERAPAAALPPAAPTPPLAPPPAAPTPRPAQPEPEVRSSIVVQRVEQEVLDIPDRFEAQVTGHRRLIRDRQLLVLDGRLLFESDNAASSGIRVGQRVDVTKASSRRGRTFQIYGPSKRAVTALRVRCERLDLSVDNSRKCALLRKDAAKN